MLACLPGEQHDLGLIGFGLALRERGWRIVYLGPDTPIETVVETSDRVQPGVVVLSADQQQQARTGAHAVAPSRTQPPRRDRRPGRGCRASQRRGDLMLLDGDLMDSASRVTELAAA